MGLCNDFWMDLSFPAELEAATEHTQSHQRSVNWSKKEARTDLRDGGIAFEPLQGTETEVSLLAEELVSLGSETYFRWPPDWDGFVRTHSGNAFDCPSLLSHTLSLSPNFPARPHPGNNSPRIPCRGQSQNKVSTSADCWSSLTSHDTGPLGPLFYQWGKDT